jgi:branched-chain amino acid transport system permease protein
MEYFTQQLINGVSLGSIYGLIAIGYTMVYGIIGMVNFAHGDVVMVGGFIALLLILMLGITSAMPMALLVLSLILVLALTMAFTAAWGWAIERIAYRPLRGSFRLAPLISAIGMSIVLVNLVQLIQGARNKPIQQIITTKFNIMESPGGFVVTLSAMQITIILTTVVVMAVFTYLITQTSLGRAQRACEQDRTMAALTGVNVDRTISLTFVMGAALAAVAGTLYLLQYGVAKYDDGFVIGIKAFTAAVLGGIGSLPGAMLGGLLIGLIENFWSGYSWKVPFLGVEVGGPEYKDVAAFSILILVLVFRPSGLLGRPEIEKV